MPIDQSKFSVERRNNLTVTVDPRVADALSVGNLKARTGMFKSSYVQNTLYAQLVKDGLIEPFAGQP